MKRRIEIRWLEIHNLRRDLARARWENDRLEKSNATLVQQRNDFAEQVRKLRDRGAA